MTLDELIQKLTELRKEMPGDALVLTKSQHYPYHEELIHNHPDKGNWSETNQKFLDDYYLESEDVCEDYQDELAQRNRDPKSWYNAVVVN